MALIPYALRPGVVIRRKALRQGFLGPSTFWKVVGVVVFGRGTLKRFFGKNPEPIASETLRSPQFISILTATPLSRKEQKRTGITRKVLERQALADVARAKGVEPTS